jgi:hypothetical protein
LKDLAVCVYGRVMLKWFSKTLGLNECIGKMSTGEGLC